MKYIEVEVVASTFRYSPNGYDSRFCQRGDLIDLPEKTAKSLLKLTPPQVKLVEDVIDVEEIVNGKANDMVENTVFEDSDLAASLSSNRSISLDELQTTIDEAGDGANEIVFDAIYTAKQKSGKWYNVFELETKLNTKGIAKDKLAKYVYDLKTGE